MAATGQILVQLPPILTYSRTGHAIGDTTRCEHGPAGESGGTNQLPSSTSDVSSPVVSVIPGWRSSCRYNAPASRDRNPPAPYPPTSSANGSSAGLVLQCIDPPCRLPGSSPAVQGRPVSRARDAKSCGIARDFIMLPFHVPVALSIIPAMLIMMAVRCATSRLL